MAFPYEEAADKVYSAAEPAIDAEFVGIFLLLLALSWGAQYVPYAYQRLTKRGVLNDER